MKAEAPSDSVGPNKLVPTLLVFGTSHRLDLPADDLSLFTFRQKVVLGKVTAKDSKHVRRNRFVML